MSQHGDTSDALESARRALAARDADLASADRVLAESVAAAHAMAVESIGRIDAIRSELDAVAAGVPQDSPAAAREFSRHLVARSREIAAVVSEAKIAARAKAVALEELNELYR